MIDRAKARVRVDMLGAGETSCSRSPDARDDRSAVICKVEVAHIARI